MSGERVGSLLKEFRRRYRRGEKGARGAMLDEFCELTGYHRKYAIVLLNAPDDLDKLVVRRRRGPTYSKECFALIEAVWEAAAYPWSERLVAMLPLWLPWARKQTPWVTDEVAGQALRVSARQIDRRLKKRKLALGRRIYGHTKPGALLKHHIAIKTDNWDVFEPGYCEIDLVSHSGPSASGEFIYSLNLTDIHTGWSETRAVMGKGEAGVVRALDDIRRALPFALKAIDSDNGSEFINHHLYRYCKQHCVVFTRGRPYKKNDNAHIEQKNWTHVRRIFGWDRYDTQGQLDAMNAIYRGPLREMMNLFQPCVKLTGKTRIGSKLQRHYDKATTPLQRLLNCVPSKNLTPIAAALKEKCATTDPFELSRHIEHRLGKLEKLRKQGRKSAA